MAFEIEEGVVKVTAEVDRSSLAKTAKLAGKELGDGLDGLSTSLKPVFSTVGLGIVAGIAAVVGPALGAAISGAVIAAGGLGVIGLGAFLLREQPGLQKAAKSLVGDLKKTFTDAAMPLLQPLIQALKIFQGTVKAIGPDVKELFSSIADSGAIQALATGVSGLVTSMMPGIKALVDASGPLLTVLGQQLPALGKAFSDMFASIAKGGPAAGLFFKDLFSIIGAAVRGLGVAIGWLATQYPLIREKVIGAFSDIKASISDVVGFVQKNQTWLGPLVAGIVGAVVAIKALITVVRIAAAVTAVWDAVLAANPIGIIIVAVAALVAALVWFFTQTKLGREIWATTWAAIQAAASAVSDWFTGTVVPALSAAWDVIKGAAEAVATWFTGTLVPALSAAWTAIQAAAAAVAGWFMTYVAPIFSALGDLMAAIFMRVQQAAGILWTVLQPIFMLIGNAWSLLWQAIQLAWTAVGPVVFAAIQTALGVMQAIWTTVWGIVKAVVVTTWDVIKTVVETALSVVAGIIRTITAVIRGDWSGAWNNIKGIVSTILNGIKSVVSSVMSGISSVIRSIMSGISSAWSSVWNGLKNAASGAINGVKTIISGVKGLVTGAFKGAASWLVSIGQQIVNGLVSGIRSKFNAARDAVYAMANSLPGWAKKLLGINSPSKVFAELGGYVVDGLIQGLSDTRGVKSAMSNLLDVGGALPSFTGPVMGGDGAALGGSPFSNAPSTGASGSTASMSPSFEVKVYVGNQEIKDITRTEINESARSLGGQVSSGTGGFRL